MGNFILWRVRVWMTYGASGTKSRHLGGRNVEE